MSRLYSTVTKKGYNSDLLLILFAMSKKKFIFGAGMFAALGIVAKLIGVFYRLPLTNILGAEGMGLYQLIFPVYSLLLAFIGGGIPAAVAKCVSELNAMGRFDETKKALGVSVVLPVAAGCVAAVLLILFRSKIAALQGNDAAGSAYIAIAPAIAVYGIIASIRGYFQGLDNLLPSGVSQLIEQAAKVVFGLALAAVFVDMGVEFAVFGALVGVSLSEVAAALYLGIRYFRGGRARSPELCFEAAQDVAIKDSDLESGTSLMRRIYSIALPVTLGSLVMPLSQAVDSFLVVNLLTESGLTTSYATSLFGLFAGPVGSLISLPSVITAALAASLLPSVAALKSRNLEVNTIIAEKIGSVLVLILPVVTVFVIAPKPILRLLYFRGLSDAELDIAAMLLRIESLNVFLLGIIQLVAAAMQGVGKAFVPALCLVAGAVMKVASVTALIPLIGIAGAAVSTVICYAITFTLDLICLRRNTGRILGAKTLKILFCVAVFASAMALYFPLAAFMGEIAALFAAFLLAAGAYLLVISKTKCILLSEMLS